MFAKIMVGSVFTIAAFAGQAFSCSCPGDPDTDTKTMTLWQRDRADFVFAAKGTLVEPYDREINRLRSIKLKVDRVWKGKLGVDIEARTNDIPGLGCEPVLTQGKTYLIFATKAGDFLKLLGCSPTMPITHGHAQQIISYLGPSIAPEGPGIGFEVQRDRIEKVTARRAMID